jgi:hypothetical protein
LDNCGCNTVAGAGIGGAVGIFFGLVADGEGRGGMVVEFLFPRGAVRCSCCERRAGQSADPCACAASYYSRCLHCDGHCECESIPARAPTEQAGVDK